MSHTPIHFQQMNQNMRQLIFLWRSIFAYSSIVFSYAYFLNASKQNVIIFSLPYIWKKLRKCNKTKAYIWSPRIVPDETHIKMQCERNSIVVKSSGCHVSINVNKACWEISSRIIALKWLNHIGLKFCAEIYRHQYKHHRLSRHSIDIYFWGMQSIYPTSLSVLCFHHPMLNSRCKIPLIVQLWAYCVNFTSPPEMPNLTTYQ